MKLLGVAWFVAIGGAIAVVQSTLALTIGELLQIIGVFTTQVAKSNANYKSVCKDVQDQQDAFDSLREHFSGDIRRVHHRIDGLVKERE